MFEIIAVTNRRLRGEGTEDFLRRVTRIAGAGVSAVALREKDLPPAAYAELAERVADICERCGVELITHGYAPSNRASVRGRVWRPFPAFAETTARPARETRDAEAALVSVHTRAEAERAYALGAAGLVAGHIFETPSKPGAPPRGPEFLSDLCANTPLPVYAIGGVSARNIRAVRAAGAAGACLLSPFMLAENPAALTDALRAALAR